jgi:cytochrome c peroxidase
MRQRNILVIATLPALALSIMVGSVGASGGTGGGGLNGLKPLSAVPAPPSNLGAYVVNRPAAIALGKALFWDEQAGGNGVQACASCHFHAGADNRTQNQLNPRVNPNFGGTSLNGPNYTLSAVDFPFRKLADPANINSSVIRDNQDVAGSEGVFNETFAGPTDPQAPIMSSIEQCTHNLDPVYKVGGINVRQVTGRNAPTVINAPYNFRNFWDGRANNQFNGVDPFGPNTSNATVWKSVNGTLVQTTVAITNASAASQAVGPPNNKVEMSCDGRQWAFLGHKLLSLTPLGKQHVAADDSVLGAYANSSGMGLNTSYADLIRQAFNPAYTSDLRVPTSGFTQMESNFSLFWGLAIDLYESTLVSDRTPFDSYAKGNTSALTPDQQAGLAIFTGQGRCAQCHNGALFTDATSGELNGFKGFHNTGVTRQSDDPGAGPIAKNSKLDGAFKTPGLRNVELTGPYMHNGSMATLRQVVDFYNRGGNFHNANLDSQIRPLGLTSTQENQLVLFMEGLTDPRVVLQQAPFDHPSLCVGNGAQGTTTSVIDNGNGEAVDNIWDGQQNSQVQDCAHSLPAVGQGGVNATLNTYLPSQRFLGMDPAAR